MRLIALLFLCVASHLPAAVAGAQGATPTPSAVDERGKRVIIDSVARLLEANYADADTGAAIAAGLRVVEGRKGTSMARHARQLKLSHE